MHVLLPRTFLSSYAAELLIGDRTTELLFKNSVTTILLVLLLITSAFCFLFLYSSTNHKFMCVACKI